MACSSECCLWAGLGGLCAWKAETGSLMHPYWSVASVLSSRSAGIARSQSADRHDARDNGPAGPAGPGYSSGCCASDGMTRAGFFFRRPLYPLTAHETSTQLWNVPNLAGLDHLRMIPSASSGQAFERCFASLCMTRGGDGAVDAPIVIGSFRSAQRIGFAGRSFASRPDDEHWGGLATPGDQTGAPRPGLDGAVRVTARLRVRRAGRARSRRRHGGNTRPRGPAAGFPGSP